MKLFRNILLALSATLILWGCNDDDELSGNGGKASISLSTSTIQVAKDGGSSTVTVTSSDDWRLSGICDWAHPSATSGKNGDVVTFTIDPNTGNETRTATFKFFTGSSVVPLTVESAPAYTLALADGQEQEMTIAKTEGTATIRLKTNVAEPEITFSDGGEEWLSYSSRTEFGGNSSFIFNVKENATYKNRSTTVTISSPLTDEPVSVNVTQKQTDAVIISEDDMAQMFDLSARTMSFTVKANVDYTLTNGGAWITNITKSDAKEGEDGLSTVTVTADLTEATEARGGYIRVNGGSGLSYDVSIVQKNPEDEIVDISDSQLRYTASYSGYIVSLTGTKCIVTAAGKNATSMSLSSVRDLTGIEYFESLTTLSINSYYLTKVDLSGLHKLTTVTVSGSQCGEFILGDNPVTSFKAGNYSYASGYTITGTAVEGIDLSFSSSWYSYYDDVTFVDVTGCPALKTLNATRGSKLTKLYLKQGQTIENLTKSDATEIEYK